MIATSLVAKAGEVVNSKKWSGHGAVIASSNNEAFLAEGYCSKTTTKTFFSSAVEGAIISPAPVFLTRSS